MLIEILTSLKAHNSVTNVRKKTYYNHKLDLVSINFVKICQFVLEILNGNEIMTDGMTDGQAE